MEKTQEEIDIEIRQIDEMFPDAKFSPSIDLENLDDKVSDKKEIIIKQDFTCYCYDNKNKSPKYFTVKCKENESLTNKYIMTELMKQKMKIDCDHRFVEGFNHLNDNVYEMWTGS
jgi:hypothetical protein